MATHLRRDQVATHHVSSYAHHERLSFWPLARTLFFLMSTQFSMRLFHILESRILGSLNAAALSLHSLQHYGVMMGQFIGLAGSTTIMILWNQQRFSHNRRALFGWVAGMTMVLSAIFSGIFYLSRFSILKQFSWTSIDLEVASTYLSIGSLNGVLFSLFAFLEGTLIAAHRQRLSLAVGVCLLVFNSGFDAVWVRYCPFDLTVALYGVGLSTTAGLALACGFSLWRIRKFLSVDTVEIHTDSFKDVLKIWSSESATMILRLFVPLAYGYALSLTTLAPSLLVTHQLALQLAYILALPLSAGTQIAIRRPSGTPPRRLLASYRETWEGPLFSLAVVPTLVLFSIAAAGSKFTFPLIYGFELEPEGAQYACLFFLGCLLGQVGHILAAILRRSNLSSIVFRGFLLSEIVTQGIIVTFLVIKGRATALNFGVSILATCFVYLVHNAFSTWRLSAVTR